MSNLPRRKSLYHDPPWWLPYQSETWFITVSCKVPFKNQLCYPKISKAISESIAHRNQNKTWFCKLLLLMPDHLHMLIILHPDHSLKKVISNWKRWLSRTHQIEWQTNFFDHRIRNDDLLHETWMYILNNPVKKNLCPDIDDWQYVWQDLEDGKGFRKRNKSP